MELNSIQITDGYAGMLGKQYHAPKNMDELNETILAAAKFNQKSEAETREMIESGQQVKWCESPNYYYDHSHGTIGLKPKPVKIEMVKCDCGCSVPCGSVMSASMGKSCPDCYDRMSE